MEKRDFKFIKGKYCQGAPADICFYTDVDYWSVESFLYELEYLINYVNPSKIRIHVNSVGGSVTEGISVFSKIIDCQIPTETINDGLAASMGSIIWAAGDELYMKDYALLMIHNPFCEDESGNGKEYNQVTEAFKQQLKTIYKKRFNMDDETIEKIMTGEEGNDGTFFTAEQAVEKGFVQADHVIETPSATKEQIQAALKDCKDITKMKAIYALATSVPPMQAIDNKNDSIFNSTKMEKNEITVFAALFGLTGEKATAENVTAKINELKAKAGKADDLQKSLEEANAQLTQVKASLTGAETSVKNLQADLETTKADLKKYQEAEAAAQEAKVKALIDKAVEDCKINKDEVETYTKMAQNDFALAESVLAKIPARDNLGNIISKANAEEAQHGVQTAEQEVQAKVESVIGKGFEFKKLA